MQFARDDVLRCSKVTVKRSPGCLILPEPCLLFELINMTAMANRNIRSSKLP